MMIFIVEANSKTLHLPIHHCMQYFEMKTMTALQISELDFQDSVLVLGFPAELNEVLLQLYLDNRKEIRHILSELAPTLPQYHNLEWRLDVQVLT